MKDNNYRPNFDKNFMIFGFAIAVVLIFVVVMAFLYASANPGNEDKNLNSGVKISQTTAPSKSSEDKPKTTDGSSDNQSDTSSTDSTDEDSQTAPPEDVQTPTVKPVPSIGSELSTEFDKEFFSSDLFIGESMGIELSIFGGIDEKNVFASNNLSHNNLLTREEKTPLGTMTSVDYATQMSPKRIFILIGTNSLSNKLKPDNMVQKLEAFVDKLGKVSPDSEIYIIAHTGINSKSDIGFTNSQIKDYNEQVEIFARVKGIGYIDAFNLLISGNGEIRDEFVANNGTFLSSKGYKALLSYIESALS